MTIYGVDISNHQQDAQRRPSLNLQQVKNEGYQFAIIKATEGTGFRDQHMAHYVAASRAAGLLTAVYLYVKEQPAADQAQVFAEHVGDTTLPVALDIEEGAGANPQLWRDIAAELTARGYRVILTYCPRWYWERIGSPSLAGLPPLWSSSYPLGYTADLGSSIYAKAGGWPHGYGGLDSPTIWQFTSSALVDGHRLDANAYEGTLDDLTALFTGQPAQKETDTMSNPELDRVHHELTHKFQSRYKKPDGTPSQFRDTAIGYALENDEKLTRLLDDVIPRIEGKLDRIIALDETR